MGQWYLASLGGNHPVAEAVLYNFAFLIILANLVAGTIYGILDPRIKAGERR
jgi:ABC-type dipeptide/oligopeptide/nickel transport system permease component